MESAFYFVLSEEVRHISSERINYFSSSYFNARVNVCKVPKEYGVNVCKVLWSDCKGFKICIICFEFESGCVSLVRAWNSQDFTRSLGPIKYTFREVGFFSNKKKM